ncbi:MAG: hypothetical protein WKF75_21740 [Singulisphaera sp.]
MRPWLTLMLVLTTGLAPASGVEPKSKKDARPLAPSDYRIFEQDMAGAYFIARPLMEEYDALRKRVAGLRADIAGARIDSARARAEVSTLQEELNGLLQKIDHAKLYIPRHGPQADRDHTSRSSPPMSCWSTARTSRSAAGRPRHPVRAGEDRARRRQRQGRRRLRRDRTRRPRARARSSSDSTSTQHLEVQGTRTCKRELRLRVPDFLGREFPT